MRLIAPIAVVWLVSAGVVEARCVQWQVSGYNLECLREVISTPRRAYRKKRYHRKSYRTAAIQPTRKGVVPSESIPKRFETPPPPAPATLAGAQAPPPAPIAALDDGAKLLREAHDRLRFEIADQKRTRMPVARSAATAGQGDAFRPTAVDARKPPIELGWPVFWTLMAVFGALTLAILVQPFVERLTPAGCWVRPRWQTRFLALLSSLKGHFHGRREPEYFPLPRTAEIPIVHGIDRSDVPGGRPEADFLPRVGRQWLVAGDGSERANLGNTGRSDPIVPAFSPDNSMPSEREANPIRPAWAANG